MHTLPRLALPLLLSGALLLAGCGDDAEVDVGTGPGSSDTTVVDTTTVPPNTVDPNDPIAVLDFHRQSWDAAAITDYDLTYRPVCFCMASTVVVHVRGDEVTVDPPTETDGYVMPADEALTVEKMFDELDSAYRGSEADDREPAASVEVTYDEDWNYPSDAYIDWSEMMADEEFGWEVIAFDAIAGTGTDDEGDTTTSTTPSDTTPTTGIAPPPTQPPTTDPADAEAALADARARWDAAGINNYELTYEEFCFCPAITMRLAVVDDAISSWENLESPEDPQHSGFTPLTIDDLFGDIETALREGDNVTVDYDPELGHPVSVSITPEPPLPDSWWNWTVISLEPTT